MNSALVRLKSGARSAFIVTCFDGPPIGMTRRAPVSGVLVKVLPGRVSAAAAARPAPPRPRARPGRLPLALAQRRDFMHDCRKSSYCNRAPFTTIEGVQVLRRRAQDVPTERVPGLGRAQRLTQGLERRASRKHTSARGSSKRDALVPSKKRHASTARRKRLRRPRPCGAWAALRTKGAA